MSQSLLAKISDRLPHSSWTSKSSQLSPMVITTIIAVVIFYGVYKLLQIGKRPEDFPPGPPTVPMFGNILQVSS